MFNYGADYNLLQIVYEFIFAPFALHSVSFMLQKWAQIINKLSY
jgi:hypothetical protein